MAKISHNDAWNNIFEDLKILDKLTTQKFFDISADEIKKRDGKEARLMTKIDHKEHLPTIMRAHDLSILAIENGLYRIAKTDPFIEISKEPQCAIKVIEPPKEIQTIDPLNIKSESAALDIANIAGMLTEVFEEQTKLTVRGRLRGDLAFMLQEIPYKIQGVQIEVDGGYEGRDGLHLVEAKIGYRSNINIRQLLYPELFWRAKLKSCNKKVHSYLFYYQDDIFRFIPFCYKDQSFSMLHQHEKAFRFSRSSSFDLSSLQAPRSIMVHENIPFPQADDFEKVHAIFLNIGKENCQSKIDIIGDFDLVLVARQYDYYFNVLRWMGLCESQNGCIKLTAEGERLLSLNIEQRMEAFARIIFSEPICFHELKGLPQNEVDFLRYKISGSTIQRRLQTIRAWIRYFEHFFTS